MMHAPLRHIRSAVTIAIAGALPCMPLGLVASSSAKEVRLSDVVREVGIFSCLSPKEAELVRLINEYRLSKGLPPIANSRSLNRVARFHVIDLYEYNPATGVDSRGMACSLHSWSDRGFWTPVCYTHDHNYKELMWMKPREITHNIYWRVAYENAYWSSEDEVVPARVLEGWKRSPAHNDMLLERGIWQKTRLRALGVGIYKNYAVVWVGNMEDPLGAMRACSQPR